MIDLSYTPSPNGHKITLFLEEAQLQYRLIHIDISKGSQFHPDFLQISPNNKIPAIIDHAPVDGGRPISLLGQNHHFSHYAPQTIPYAIERYQVETQRLYNVMNKRLESSPWLGGDHYSIADIASWPWIHAHQRQRIDLDNYPAVNNWHERIRTRPATERAMQQALSEKR